MKKNAIIIRVKKGTRQECSIKWVEDISPGIPDMAVYSIAQKEKRIILTEDKDFGELAVRYYATWKA